MDVHKNFMEMENNSLKSIVYITINTITNKIYIGVHITETPYKFDNYWGCGITGTSSYWFKHPKYPFQKACKKYGLDAFKRYTLYVFDTYEEALQKEKEIVNESFLQRSDVYNIALGGGSGLITSTEIEVHRYDLNGNYMESYRSYSDAGRKNNISYMSIISAVHLKGVSCNSYWSEIKVAKLDISSFKKINKTKVYLYKSTGEYVKQFESESECARALDVRLSTVQRAIKNGTKCSGYFLKLEYVDKIEIKTYSRKRNHLVYQYDENGNFLKEFKNLKEVRNFFNDPMSQLSKHIFSKSLYKNYYWSYEKLSKYPITKTIKKRIAQYDLSGNLIKIWDSYRECSKEFSNIRYVLNGKRSNTKGYVFKYL